MSVLVQGPVGPDGPRGDVGLRGVAVSNMMLLLIMMVNVHHVCMYVL